MRTTFFSCSGADGSCSRLFLLLLGMLILASGCTTTTSRSTINVSTITRPASVLVMPIDIELSLLTSGGLEEPKADWTEVARYYVSKSLDRELVNRNSSILHYQKPSGDIRALHDHQQLQKLYSAVSFSILLHTYNPKWELPSKKDAFDWTLGSGVERLVENTGADYLMFVYIRDSYATAGRMEAVFTMATLGISMRGGFQEGVASLVDARTGDIVWFNRLINVSDDLRNQASAQEAITKLLIDFPL